METHDWLVSPAADAHCLQASAALRRGESLVAVTRSLRKALTPEQTHAVLELIDLRHRGQEKFTSADRMFFTRVGLQQATDEQIARYKAFRFPTHAVVADLCCGIGGDTLALAARGPCVAIDRDPAVLCFAAANVAAVLPSASEPIRFFTEDVSPASLRDANFWHLDPDRRAEGRRTVQLDAFSPPLSAIDQLLQVSPDGGVKLAPATEVPASWHAEAECEWISRAGECRQQVAWFGSLASAPGRRRATIVAEGVAARSLVGIPAQSLPVSDRIASYLYEPDAAILAAELTGVLATELNLAAIAAGSVYLTSDAIIHDAAIAGFHVRDVLPLDRRRLKSYFRERAIGRLEIKQRGVPVSIEKLRSELDLRGTQPSVLFVTRLGTQIVAIIADRLT
jgi:SAM-dependent methyltransferase